MYLSYYSLDERPFTISPDPRFLFMSNRYREALAHLNYGIEDGGGFVLLTGEVGTGKTTVCRCLLQQLSAKTRLAFVLNPKLNSVELLATICDELKIDYPENCTSLKTLTDKISEYLLECYEKDLSVVLMIDEAQNIEDDVLEQIRLLTNLETNQKKLLQIILVGQPELQEKLASRELRQLAQRITARYHLKPLSVKETIAYVMHRVKVAGGSKNLFSKKSIELLHEKTMGIPRLVNTICDRALVSACNLSKHEVNEKIMKVAANDVLGMTGEDDYPILKQSKRLLIRSSSVILAVLMLAFVYWLGTQNTGTIVAEYQPETKEHFKIKNENSNLNSNKNEIGSETEINNSENPQHETLVSNVTNPKLNALPNSLINQMLGTQRWDINGQESLAIIMKKWNLSYSPFTDGDACEFAFSYGLLCEKKVGNWQNLREFNRPAILQFSAGLQGKFWGALIAIQGSNADLVFGDNKVTLSLNELSTIWTGEFKLVWQAPEGYTKEIRQGDSGVQVVWLATQLKSLVNPDLVIDSTFGSSLQEALINYQNQRQLRADGIAGMRTILYINTETLEGIPKLID